MMRVCTAGNGVVRVVRAGNRELLSRRGSRGIVIACVV